MSRPINRIPTEILAAILVSAIQSMQPNIHGKAPHWRIRSVCRLWKEVADTTPQFWSEIRFPAVLQADSPIRQLEPKRLEGHLRLSKDAPLSIDVVVAPRPLLEAVPRIAHRLVSLKISMPQASRLEAFVDQLAKSTFPHLRELALESLDAIGTSLSRLHPEMFPILQNLTLRCLRLDFASLTSLKSLTLIAIPAKQPSYITLFPPALFSFADLLDILAQLPQLTDLTLKRACSHDTSTIARTVELPRLESIYIHNECTQIVELLQSIALRPSTAIILDIDAERSVYLSFQTVGNEVGYLTTALQNWQLDGPSLQSLKLQVPHGCTRLDISSCANQSAALDFPWNGADRAPLRKIILPSFQTKTQLESLMWFQQALPLDHGNGSRAFVPSLSAISNLDVRSSSHQLQDLVFLQRPPVFEAVAMSVDHVGTAFCRALTTALMHPAPVPLRKVCVEIDLFDVRPGSVWRSYSASDEQIDCHFHEHVQFIATLTKLLFVLLARNRKRLCMLTIRVRRREAPENLDDDLPKSFRDFRDFRDFRTRGRSFWTQRKETQPEWRKMDLAEYKTIWSPLRDLVDAFVWHVEPNVVPRLV